jgi:hypothetical protein
MADELTDQYQIMAEKMREFSALKKNLLVRLTLMVENKPLLQTPRNTPTNR